MNFTHQNNSLFIFLFFFCLLTTVVSFLVVKPEVYPQSSDYILFGPPDNAG